MTQIILIPAGQTDWRAQDRMTGDADLPLNETGKQQAAAYAKEIAALQPALIRCGREEATKQTANIIAHELKIKFRAVDDLREMDLGIWEGLTQDDFKERYGKVYKQWRLQPESITPPEGESVSDVASRLETGLTRILKRHADDKIVLALGPLACAIMRCRTSDQTYEHFWDYVEEDAKWRLLDLPARV